MSRFSQNEMERRLRSAQSFLVEKELDAALFGGSGGRQPAMRWLTQYGDPQSSVLIVPREGDPTLLVSFLNHLPNAREVSSVPTEWGGDAVAEKIASLLQPTGGERVGVIGGDGLGGGLPHGLYVRITELLPQLELVDVTDEFLQLLLVKSEEEIEKIREAAGLTDLALQAIADNAKPGVSEHQLVANAEYAYRLEGGQVGITFLRSMPMDAPTGIVPAQTPTDRRLGVGDVIVTEISAASDGYSGQVLWPIFVGAEPTKEWQQLFDTAFETYNAVATTVRHGATVGDAIAAAEPIRRNGYTICDDLVHGFGLSLCEPYVEPTDFESPPKDGGMRLERGMTIVIQPNPITRDERIGIQLGAAVVVRDDGTECLHKIPSAPLIAG